LKSDTKNPELPDVSKIIPLFIISVILDGNIFAFPKYPHFPYFSLPKRLLPSALAAEKKNFSAAQCLSLFHSLSYKHRKKNSQAEILLCSNPKR
jgi:hypothetical protein